MLPLLPAAGKGPSLDVLALARQRAMEDGMMIRALLSVAMGLALLTSGGCQQAHTIRDDLFRALSSPPTPQSRNVASARPVARPTATSVESAKLNTPEPPSAMSVESAKPSTPEPSTAAADAAANSPAPTPPNGPAVQLVGKSENEIRALLGPPTEEQDQPPGKRWRYRDGQCTLYVQLFADVQTKQFGALMYAVKSNDDTGEGRRLGLAEFQA